LYYKISFSNRVAIVELSSTYLLIQNEESLVNCLKSWVKENTEVASKSQGKEKTSKRSRFTSTIEDGLAKVRFDEDGEIQGTPESIGNHLVLCGLNKPPLLHS
jgi:hypothetical protein